ncbi:chemotaxis protein CheW [Burkholderia sp. TSV86]|uniref:chemotaxis protein CheW n=1 Tax=Burkholderia sp. TSV86 TaxID=1385594 RepID=UPI000755A356|nr:chemotaxis protein CheW [Burkholderia sp. TSV86]KVE35128.1 chemotaxis protein CheA [Burkholderia sp. TSV86]
MSLDITQFYQTFFDEADELLAQMEQLLLNLNVAAPDPEDLAAIFRAAHSIKGGAATFGFTALTETTHILESLLDRARNHELTLTKEMVDAFLETKDVLSDQLADYRASAEPDAAAAAAICAKLERLKASASGAGAARTPAGASEAASAAGGPAAAPVARAFDTPEHVVEQALDAAHPTSGADSAADAAEGPHLKIVLTGAGDKDQALLTEELGNLGRIAGRKRLGDALTLWLETDVPSDDIVAVCCFVIDESQIAIGRGSAPAGAGAEAAARSDADAGAAGQPASHAHATGLAQAQASSFVPLSAASANSSATPEPATVPATQSAAPLAAASAPAGRGATPSAPPASAEPVVPAPSQPFGAAPVSTAAAAHHADDRKPRPAVASAEGSSIRVGVEKVDQLINLVGELVITQAMLAETASTFDPALHDRLFNGMAQLERNARDLQEAVMSIRMMPMDYVFSRFPRLVRDLAGKLGKQVELVTFGQATELDKSLIERIIDPLTHLVRNSLDHGVETVDKRRAAGKDPVGQLVLSAAHHGGNIVIEVSDDGAGLNRDKILATGFSTAEVVTDVSGRGVGMDVVKRNIQSMGGHVEIASVAGRGTTTRIVLPLTLAILDGMSVKVGSEIFILPLNFVMESLQPCADDIYTIGNGERVVRVRGEYLPLIALHEVFSVADARTDPTQGIVTIMQTEGRRFAMLIDELVGQQQVVVKNLETNYRKVYGISAATILGDGSVALIVDVAALNRETRATHGVHPGAALAAP